MPSPIFGDGSAGEKIAEILATTDFKIQKRLNYLCVVLDQC